MTGEQIKSDIYLGPTYYMRLKQMVKDKINYRSQGPRTQLTRQTVQGRANDGGLRVGEMERDGILGHGAAHFLNESLMVRGDEYHMAVCNKSGMIAIYNPNQNLFMSPMVDGPIQYSGNIAESGGGSVIQMSKFGRSFSIVRIPYCLKLLMQELLIMNVQMRIITDDNIDQLPSMSYSNNIYKVLKDSRGAMGVDDIIEKAAITTAKMKLVREAAFICRVTANNSKTSGRQVQYYAQMCFRMWIQCIYPR
jgi:DNA-directed RNA polymerase II subunit RPB2